MIAHERLRPGDQLPPEHKLSELLGVSKNSLREAVRMLVALNVLEVRHGSGTYVAALRPETVIRSLSLTVGLLPLQNMMSLFEMRRVLEGHVAGQAASRVTDDDLDYMADLVEQMDQQLPAAEISALDRLFHLRLAELAGNPAITALLDVLRIRWSGYPLFDVSENREEMRRISNAGHREILSALSRRDSAEAMAVMHSHILYSQRWNDDNSDLLSSVVRAQEDPLHWDTEKTP